MKHDRQEAEPMSDGVPEALMPADEAGPLQLRGPVEWEPYSIELTSEHRA